MPPEQLAYTFLGSYIAMNFPGYNFARHNIAIIDALQKVESGEITRLIVNLPPRHSKTMTISEFFPAWYLGRNPDHQVIAATYAYDRAGDTGRKVRNQMVDPLHRRIFPGCTISLDSKGANKLATDQGGMMFSTGVGGAIVGRGAHLFVIDDPIKSREEAESDVARAKLIDWFRGVAYTRLMDHNRIILVQTRWHNYDLTGWLLEETAHAGWHVLAYPALAYEDDPLGRKPNEALWPEKYPVARLEEIKSIIGLREWSAQYQQEPMVAEGGLVNPNWFEYYPSAEWKKYHTSVRLGDQMAQVPFGIKKIVCSWDTAFKESQLNDPSACTVWGISDHGYYLLYVYNKRVAFPKLMSDVARIYEENKKYRLGSIPVLIEDKASGQSLIQELKKKTRIPIFPIKTDTNKTNRLSEVTSIMESGRVFLPDKAWWLEQYLRQLSQFPLGKHDDMVDSTSQFLRWADKPKYKKSGIKYWK